MPKVKQNIWKKNICIKKQKRRKYISGFDLMNLTPPEKSRFSLKPQNNNSASAPVLEDVADLKAQLLQDIGQPNLDADNCEC